MCGLPLVQVLLPNRRFRRFRTLSEFRADYTTVTNEVWLRVHWQLRPMAVFSGCELVTRDLVESQPFRSRAISLPRTFAPWNFLHGTFRSWNFCSRERMF